MALTVKQLLFRRGVLLAATTSAGLILVMALITALKTVVPQAWYFRFDLQVVGTITLDDLLGSLLPFGLGVFLCLWILAPIAAALELRFVVTRAVLAAVAGAFVLFLVNAVIPFVHLANSGRLVTANGAGLDLDVKSVGLVVLSALILGASAFLEWVALVVVAGIFQWSWVTRHPPRFEVAGLIDG